MKFKHICNAGGYIFAAAGTVAFAYALGALFNAPFWVALLMFIFAAILLLAAFKLWDAAEDGMAIEEAKKFIGQVDESYGVLGDSDIYNAVSLVDELDGLTTEENRLYDRINDIDTKIYETESKIIELAEKLEEKYATTEEPQAHGKDKDREVQDRES